MSPEPSRLESHLNSYAAFWASMKSVQSGN